MDATELSGIDIDAIVEAICEKIARNTADAPTAPGDPVG